MGNQQETVTDFELGWLSGIIDGEGCFSMSSGSNGSWNIGIKIVNTDNNILAEIKRILTKMKVEFLEYDSWRASNQRPGKRIDINGPRRVSLFLQKMMPYFNAKKKQAQVLADWVRHRRRTAYGELDLAFTKWTHETLKDLKSPAPQRLNASYPEKGSDIVRTVAKATELGGNDLTHASE